MPLKDLLLFGIVAILVPKILAHPYVGILLWVIFGTVNPHRMTWGPAYDFPFSIVIAILTLIGIVITRDHRKIKGGPPGVVLLAFTVWICFTELLPVFNPEDAYRYWAMVVKEFVMVGALLLLLHTRRHVELLVWTLVVSLGYFGVKGGAFTILTGGQYRVWGPPDSAIENNNTLAVALVIIIPLMVHLFQQNRSKWLRLGLTGAIALCSISVLGSWSRGALLSIFAMSCLLWLRSSHKLPVLIGTMLLALATIPAMPDAWFERMHSIGTYEADTGSAMARLTAWETAYNLAKDKFPIGGGFEYNGQNAAAKYSPNPDLESVAHSIYFQVLGSQGFVGLAIFLVFWAFVWRQCDWIRRQSRDYPDLRWAFSLASMTQVALVGYFVGGAFLNLAFWELPYFLYAAMCITQYAVTQELALLKSGSSARPRP